MQKLELAFLLDAVSTSQQRAIAADHEDAAHADDVTNGVPVLFSWLPVSIREELYTKNLIRYSAEVLISQTRTGF
jgi:hypothetical protein